MNTLESLPADWQVPRPLFRRLGQSLEKQRCLAHEGHLLIVLHEIPADDTLTRKGYLLWRNPEGALVANDAPDGLKRGLKSLRAYNKRLQELGKVLDGEASARQLFHLQKALQPLSRALRNAYLTLQTACEQATEDASLMRLRDEALKLDRESDFILAEARAAMDTILAEEAEAQSAANMEMTRAAHRLNRLVALFLPMTAAASLFGMNLASGMENAPIWVFWVVFIGGIGLGWVMRNLVIDNRTIPHSLKLRLDRQSQPDNNRKPT